MHLPSKSTKLAGKYASLVDPLGKNNSVWVACKTSVTTVLYHYQNVCFSAGFFSHRGQNTSNKVHGWWSENKTWNCEVTSMDASVARLWWWTCAQSFGGLDFGSPQKSVCFTLLNRSSCILFTHVNTWCLILEITVKSPLLMGLFVWLVFCWTIRDFEFLGQLTCFFFRHVFAKLPPQ